MKKNEKKSFRGAWAGNHDLCVLHLSDLHIGGTVLSDKYTSLIKDITAQLKEVQNIVLAVTGDIALHGEVSKSKEAIIEFFMELHEALADRVVDVEIVPGNHDVNRSYIFNKSPYQTALTDYLALVDQIVTIFGERKRFHNAYGVDVVDCGGRSICFLRADTSWFMEGVQFGSFVRVHFEKEQMSKADIEDRRLILRDSKNARINEYIRNQLAAVSDELNIQRRKAIAQNSPIEVVIALAHHPLSWLMKTSRLSYADFLGSRSIPKVDIWMCGHAHDVKIHYDNDDNQSMAVLMSGVGSEEQRRSIHRYSIYHLSLVRNVCSIQVRASRPDGNFKDDDILLPTETSYDTGRYCYPLKTKSPGSIIRLNACESNPQRAFYADQHALESMQQLVERLIDLGSKLMKTIGTQVQIYKSLPVNDDRRKIESFVGFLSRICDDIVAALVMESSNVGKLTDMPLFGEDANVCATHWRVHFRATRLKVTGANLDIYRCIAHSGGAVPWGGSEKESGLQDIKWESLISKSFSHQRKMLIRSVNDDPNANCTAWDDYLTAVIDIPENLKTEGERQFPLLTFGISARSDNYESSVVSCRFLYLLEFFNINKMVSLALSGFLKKTGFQLETLMEKCEK